MPTIKDKVVWVTGASSGIGEALAYAMAQKGSTLILSARRKEELERVKKNCVDKFNATVFLLPLDLALASTLQKTVEDAIGFAGHVDILINNGGLGQRSLILETTVDVDRQLMEVNYFGSMALSKYLLPHFISRRKGHFVTISSLTGKFGTPYRSTYAASKHALHGFFDSLRAEHCRDNVCVTMICPGFIHTNLASAAIHGKNVSEEDKRSYKRKSAEWCAEKIIRAIEHEKEEVYLGGKEVFAVYIKRFFPSLFSKIIRNVAVR
jgi:short-subunit dehydrogenase